MSTRTSTLKFTLLAGSLVGLSCTDKGTVDSAIVCEAPVAVAAGTESVTLGATVTLDASGSNVCATYADSALYTWSFEQVPAGSAVDESSLTDNLTNSAETSSFIPDLTGDYVLTLQIEDSLAESTVDYIVVTVVTGDQPPVANCGEDQTGATGESITLDGSESYDPEGAILEYYWSVSGVPDCSEMDSEGIYNSAGPSPSVVPDCDGIYTIALVVSDSVQYSDPDICYIDVASGNRAPVADAGDGSDYTSCADNPLPLNGWGSYDLDGDELTYLWSIVSTPDGSAATDTSITDTGSAEPDFYWDEAGEYIIQLQVSDGEFWSAPDVVTFSIGSDDGNSYPYANAGENIEVNTDADCETASYVWTCEDCPEETFELDGTSSYDDDGDDLSFTWSESTGVVDFSNPWGPLTEATIEEQAATYGVDNTLTFDINLEVADCEYSDNDTITVTYTCTGEAP